MAGPLDSPSIASSLETEAWALFLAAWYGMAGFVVDRKFYCEAEAVFAVTVIVALHVPQRVQLCVWLLADHAFG